MMSASIWDIQENGKADLWSGGKKWKKIIVNSKKTKIKNPQKQKQENPLLLKKNNNKYKKWFREMLQALLMLSYMKSWNQPEKLFKQDCRFATVKNK